MIKYKNNINVGTGSVGYEADATSAAPLDTVGEGRIVKSEGRTVKWNQLVQNGDFSNGTAGWRESYSTYLTISANNNVLSTTIIATSTQFYSFGIFINDNTTTFVAGHKYLFTGKIKSPKETTFKMRGPLVFENSSIELCTLEENVWSVFSVITPVIGGKLNDFYYAPYSNINSFAVNDVIQYKDMQIVDLTSIFGAGNEPATVEAFEEWMSENMVEQDYYAYDAGSLVPVTVKGVKRDVGGTTVTNPMPVTTLKDENDVVMFPDGLKSAGSVKDEIDWENGVAVKRIGVVDLGDLTWVRVDDGCFYADLQSKHSGIKLICSKYQTYNKNFGWNTAPDKSIGSADNQRVYCKDSDYTDATAFTIAMDGVLLYYELATPITYHFAIHADLKKRVVKIGESVEVDGIEGETVVWNQLVQNGDFSDGSTGWTSINNGTFSVVDGVMYVTCPAPQTSLYVGVRVSTTFIENHKYYIAISTASTSTSRLGIYCYVAGFVLQAVVDVGNSSCIVNSTGNGSQLSIAAQPYPNSCEFTIYNVQAIDLTLMFGSGNEPSTVDEFESWLSAHGGIKDYYPYCAGELKDKEEGEVRGVGFNLWDEVAEKGEINASTGANQITDGYWRCKNYIPILPSTDYFVFASVSGTPYIRGRFYDANKNYIGTGDYNNQDIKSNSIFKSPSNAYYFRFAPSTSVFPQGTKLCINISDPSRNGTYVPYKSITRSVDLTTLKGKVDGAGEDVVMFPDGMKQAGSVKDEIFVEGGVVKAVKRVGTVDLGELEWRLRNNYADLGDIYSPIDNVMAVGVSGQTVISCDGLKALPNDIRGNITESSYICVEPNYRTIDARITDHTLTDAQVKASLEGIHANYELASPVTYVVNMQGMEMAEVKKVMVGTNLIYEK